MDLFIVFESSLFGVENNRSNITQSWELPSTFCSVGLEIAILF